MQGSKKSLFLWNQYFLHCFVNFCFKNNLRLQIFNTLLFFQNVTLKILTLVLFMLNLAASKLGLVVTQNVIPSDTPASCSGVNECGSVPLHPF
jgi:hypothetical protein